MAPKTLPSTGYITGFCQNGYHEGEARRNYRGEPMAFCRGQWSTHLHGIHTHHACGCNCHTIMTQVMMLDKKVVSRIIKGSETGMEADFLADMCETSVEVVERIVRQPDLFAGLIWETGERVWLTGKWWRDDDEGLRPVETYVRPWSDPKWTRGREDSEVVKVVTANQRDEELEATGSLTKDQMRVRRAIKVGILPPNPDYVHTKRDSSGGVTEAQALANGFAHLGLKLREGVSASEATLPEEQKATRVAGQLEREVKEVCDLFTLGLLPHIDRLTCTMIAREIDVDNPPSTGAITNVLKRWSEVGFAVHETGPHRFGGYTPEGIEVGLDELYARVGRSERGAATRALHSFHRRR